MKNNQQVYTSFNLPGHGLDWIPNHSDRFQESCHSITLQYPSYLSSKKRNKTKQYDTKWREPHQTPSCRLRFPRHQRRGLSQRASMTQEPTVSQIHAREITGWTKKTPGSEMHGSPIFTIFPIISFFHKYAKGGYTPSTTFIVFLVKPCQTWIK